MKFKRENYDMFLPKDSDVFMNNIGCDVEKPIKIVYEGGLKLEEDNEGNLEISRPLKLSEIVELFDVSIKDVMEGKIGMWTLEGEE